MRKIASSGKTECATRLSSRAEARSRPNGFSTMTRASFGQACRSQPLDDSFKEQRWDRQIMGRMPGIAQLFFDGGECLSIAIVPAYITQKRKKPVKRFLVIDPSGMLKTVFHARMQLRQAPLLKSDTDDGNR